MNIHLSFFIFAFCVVHMLSFSSVGLQRAKPLFNKQFRSLAMFSDRAGRDDNEFRGRSDNRFSSSGRGRSSDGGSYGREERNTRGKANSGPPQRYNERQRFDDNRYSQRQPDYHRKEEKTEPAWGYYDGDHLFGINPVSLALSTTRRKIKELLVQEGMDMANKKDKTAALNILKVAKERDIPIREFSRHDLNMITDNKVHQGFVLRAEPLEFEALTHLEATDKFSCVLALDEVWDPMNFGALVRTSFFLGVDKIVICAKNSAPLTPTVSKASAGAVELVTIYTTKNLMSFLDKSVTNGWQVVGTDLGPTSTPLNEFSVNNKPTILVLGNEGHGMRTNIKKRCTSLVRISRPRGGAIVTSESNVDTENAVDVDSDDSSGDGGVDSLNVSVTGGIILNHLLQSRK